MLFKAMMNCNIERNFISNQNGAYKTNSISENMSTIEVSFEFY